MKHVKTLFKSGNCRIVIGLGEIEQCNNYKSQELNKQGWQQQYFYLSSNFNLKRAINASLLISSISLPSGLLLPYITRRLLQAFNMEKRKTILPVRIFSIRIFSYDANKVFKVIHLLVTHRTIIFHVHMKHTSDIICKGRY